MSPFFKFCEQSQIFVNLQTMGKIMAVDYGKKRCGIAVTDDMQIIASGLQTVETVDLFPFLAGYFTENRVEAIVVGLPTDLKGNLSEIEQEISGFIEKFKMEYPEIEVHRFDERFTSKMASFFISQSGKSKKKREEKGLVDKVSATLILQNYLEQKQK
jgi:putative Holliday junction resolvase